MIREIEPQEHDAVAGLLIRANQERFAVFPPGDGRVLRTRAGRRAGTAPRRPAPTTPAPPIVGGGTGRGVPASLHLAVTDLRLSLPPDATSASVARRAVREACADLAVDLDAVLLCTSELVANAVLHGSPPLHLGLAVRESHLRVEVHDGDGRLARRRDPLANDTLSGRGLGIVEMLSTRWGSEQAADGKVTWFEIGLA